jgi:predicted RNase H-like HicB family nuclease
MRYAIFLEKDPGSDYGVTVPDLPGCFSAGTTVEEALENAEEAILTHIEGLMMDGDAIPNPSSIDLLKDQNQSSDVIWGIVTVDITRLSTQIKRINITLPEYILSKIDTYIKEEGENRSGLLATAALEYISRHRM